MKTLTATTLSYIAGLFDGEGDCTIQSYRVSKSFKRYLRVYVRISNTNRACLEFVRLAYGKGHVGILKTAKITPSGAVRKTCYQFRIANNNGLEFLKALRPYLIVKAAKVDSIVSGRNHGPE